MNSSWAPVFIVLVSSVTGGVVQTNQQTDAEQSGSHGGWTSVDYNGHAAHLVAEAQAKEAALWRAKEFSKAKALAGQHVAIAAWKAQAAAEEQMKALAFQAAAQAKSAADQEAAHALWKAKEAATEEQKALYAAQEAEIAGTQANAASLAAKTAAEEANKFFLAAQARAEEEEKIAADKAKTAEEERNKAVLASQAKAAADEAAAIAKQKAKMAEEAFWQAKHAAWTW